MWKYGIGFKKFYSSIPRYRPSSMAKGLTIPLNPPFQGGLCEANGFAQVEND
jgi:hypothetical protein